MGHKLEKLWISAKGDSIQKGEKHKTEISQHSCSHLVHLCEEKSISRRTSGKIMNSFIVNGVIQTRQTNKPDVESPQAISEEPF